MMITQPPPLFLLLVSMLSTRNDGTENHNHGDGEDYGSDNDDGFGGNVDYGDDDNDYVADCINDGKDDNDDYDCGDSDAADVHTDV